MDTVKMNTVNVRSLPQGHAYNVYALRPVHIVVQKAIILLSR